ncbi:bifunctional 4-hydroxy-2-oxoglutarate aldolase/2-dehydro-3-deoxy-phosphogluconate aldolase [Limibacillus halophilus]|jgi:2-dehydro-3-deoxyphosphogluconate aldolase/(4S)-4-hydroxy-2-oxoglutarate aldolase
MISTRELCSLAPVVPVIVLDRLEDALPAGLALVAGGLKVLEITLRTPVALDVIRVLSQEIPEAVVGAGSVNTPDLLMKAKAAGAQFAVAPGCTPSLLSASRGEDLALLPGANTPSEIMTLLDEGLEVMKFFPAEQAGGAAFLKSIAGPLPQARFCPTGGITPEKARDYLALPNVLCVGGSWVLPKDALAAGDWAKVTALASACAGLKG